MIGNDKKGDFMNDITQGYQPLPKDKWGCDITPTEEEFMASAAQIKPQAMRYREKMPKNTAKLLLFSNTKIVENTT